MIRNVVFDIGNVLMDFWGFYDNIGEIAEDDKERDLIVDAMFRSGLWNELDRGVRPEKEILAEMRGLAEGHEEVFDQTMASVGKCIHHVDHAIPWITELQERGYHVFYLSNYSRKTMKANWSALDFLPYMDGGVFSCEAKLTKPDPAIYALLLSRYSLDPAECVFVDDIPDNLRAAEELGFRTVQFRSFEEAHEELEKILTEEDE